MVAGWCPRTDELGKRLAHGNAEGHYVGDAREPSFAGWGHPKTAPDHWSRQPWRAPEITWIKRDYRLTLLVDDSVAYALDEVAYHWRPQAGKHCGMPRKIGIFQRMASL
jgi:hypothetical protein